MLHDDKNKSHVNIIMYHVDTSYHACREQKYASIHRRRAKAYILQSLKGNGDVSISQPDAEQHTSRQMHDL